MLCLCAPLSLPDIDQLNVNFLKKSVTETSLTIEVTLSGGDLITKFENTR